MAAKRNKTTASGNARKAEVGSQSAPFIAAAGASGAESLSLERFLAELTVGEEMAVVLVFHSRKALDDARFTEALSKQGRTLTRAARGALVEPGRIYWSSLNTILTIENGRFRIRDAQEPPGNRGTIDRFLISVAQDTGKKAIGILFSGTQGDGALGITAIKEAGGLTLAEEGTELSAGGIVPSHGRGAIADFVLPPEEMAKRVQLHVSHAARYDEAAGISGAPAGIATIAHGDKGPDLHGGTPNTFHRLRPRRVRSVQAKAVDAKLARKAKAIAKRYMPAYVVTDGNFDVTHFSDRMGRFLEPAGGTATLNLLALVHNDLRLGLRTALTRASEERQVVQVDGLRMGQNGKRIDVDIVVEPVRDQPDGAPGFVVVFKDRPGPSEVEAAPRAGGALRDGHVRHLETNLRVARERLQATIEELENTNEALETSKEELQSATGEIAYQAQELGRSNRDLKNLMESTQIATIFLDSDMRVTHYTPTATEIFHLVATDLGRPIGHIKPRIAYDELQDDARRVIRSLGSVTREIEDPATGTCYMARVLPYRSIDSDIGGAVVTFLDVTPLTWAQQALRESEERFRAMAEQAEVGIAMTDREGRAIYVNDRYCEILGLARGQIVGRAIQELTPPDERGRGDALLARALLSGETSIDEIRHRRPNGSIVWVRNNVNARRDAAGAVVGCLIVAIDMTERVRAEEALREKEQHTKLLLAELQHRVRSTLAVVRSITRRTAANSNTVDDYAMHLEGRIEAFARTQIMATRSAVPLVDLEELVRDELLAHAVRDDQKAHVEGPSVRLRTAVADKLGLAIHELAANAVKYGAFAEDGGHIDVTWSIEGMDGDRMLKLEWRETGVHMASAAPRRRGFGTELIERTLPSEIDAQTALEFTPGGVRCVIALPINPRTALLGRVHPSDGPDEDDRPDERRSSP